MIRRRRSATARQKGSVLVLAMWFLLLLSGLAIAIAATVRTDAHLAHNLAEAAQAREAAQAAIRRTVLELLAADGPEKRTVGGYRIEILGTPVDVEVIDECGKVDLNTAWGLLIRAIAGDEEAEGGAVDVGEAILDWRDPDERRRSKGAEDSAYTGARRDYGPHNGSFETVEELQLVLGVTPAVYRRMAPMVTVDCLNSGIDPLLASRAVMERVPGLDPVMLQGFLDLRDQATPEEADKLAESLEEDQRYLEVSLSSAFGVTATARRPSGAEVVWHAVVWITGDPQRPHLYRVWREEPPGSEN